MNLQHYIEKLHDSEQYKEFIQKNPDTYICSGFFIIDKETEGKGDKVHIDFYDPKEKQIFSFQLSQDIQLVPIDPVEGRTPNKLNEDIDFDFNEVEELINKKVEEEKISNKIQKILLSLQNIEGKDFLVGTVFISGLGLIKIQIDIDKMEIIEFEKKSFFDIIRKK